MTAKEIINQAATLPMEASMLQVVQARKDLNMIGDIITNEEMQNNWRDALAHLDVIEEDQAEKISQSIPVRII